MAKFIGLDKDISEFMLKTANRNDKTGIAEFLIEQQKLIQEQTITDRAESKKAEAANKSNNNGIKKSAKSALDRLREKASAK